MTVPVTMTVHVVARVGDATKIFTSQEDAQAWVQEMQLRLSWMERIGLLRLVNGPDKRWGWNGWEYIGCWRGRRSLELTLHRALTYIGKWMSFAELRPDEFPLDLTGLIVDRRPIRRVPVKAFPSNVIIPSSWKREGDEFVYREPGMLLYASFEYWEPVTARAQLSLLPVEGAELLEATT